MNNLREKWAQLLASADLQAIVAQILDHPTVKILDWQIKKLTGGAAEYTGRGLGIYRLTGLANYDDLNAPWSVILKVSGPSDNASNNDPTMPEYWKREVLAYQSGVLKHLPDGVIAPHCYAIQELSDGKCRLWLEDIHEDQPSWTMEQHELVARHLGQFNGTYLAGHPLPEYESWMLPGRTHQWVEMNPPDKEYLLRFSETDLGSRWLSEQSIERIVALWEMRQPLLAALDRLPTCFCHHDAFRRNMMLRKTESGTTETVAIDWSYTGYGKVGQEIGITTATNLFFMEIAAKHAKELDNTIFRGYCAGLRDAGWQGDLQLARFGYTVTAALTSGVAFTVIIANIMNEPAGIAMGEVIIGHPTDDIMKQYGELQPFLLDLGDEALALLPLI